MIRRVPAYFILPKLRTSQLREPTSGTNSIPMDLFSTLDSIFNPAAPGDVELPVDFDTGDGTGTGGPPGCVIT